MTQENLRGFDVLRNPALNKGTAFTQEERDRFGLRGLLPPHVSTIDEQLLRVREGLGKQPDDLQRYVYLSALHDRNETLFYRLLMDSVEQLMPIVYTPTVGRACQEFAHIFQRPRGLFISIKDHGRIGEALRNWPAREAGVIVVTDGERILGLGDLGANGMGIPVGKLSLYTACGGIPPSRTLPVLLDVGTDNEHFLGDRLYIGLRQKRARGEAYDRFVDEFVEEANRAFPGVLIQFEDFGNANAFRLLHRWRDRVACFNDDIQGTAAVTLAGVHSALRITRERLRDQVVLCLGAGEAAIGICDLIAEAMAADGLSEADARRRCWLVDSKGLVVASRTDLSAHKSKYAHPHAPAHFLGALRDLRPSILVGAAGQGGSFSREVLTTMAQQRERPVIFALSNPTSKSECTAEDAYRFTEGRAVFASGSPFEPVRFGASTFVPGQANNCYVFPGIGLGAVASRASKITDEMFSAAARRLADLASEQDLAMGRIYPPLSRIQEVSAEIAVAVAEVAFGRGLSRATRPDDLRRHVESVMYRPSYG